ncbi:MAG: cytochrome c [Thermoanaerobaculia bacterium]|nr:cytochrome c [Thermoanaerobaculia bacterium]
MNKKARAAVSLAFLVAFAPAVRAADERSENWQMHCSVCHGEDGKAKTEQGKKKKARDLTNAKWQDTIDDGRIVKSITKGHDEMPAFGKKLTEPEIKALAAEVRSLVKKAS